MTRYHVSLGGMTHEVLVENGRAVSLDGEAIDAVLERVGPAPVRALRVGPSVHGVVAERSGAETWRISLRNGQATVEAIDDRARTIREMSGADEGVRKDADVKAPMPGLVIKVSVAPGDRVRQGQPIAIVEAMKMENELVAEVDGEVVSVAVAAGDTVDKSQVLVELSPEPVGDADEA